ncbi:hypothetical protein [Bacillus toyonensis]|nr:hypothetical protein [Bacillus toyonensis]
MSYTLEEAGYKIFVQAWGLCSRK